MKRYISIFIIAALLTAAFAGFGGTALAGPDDADIILNKSTVSADAGDKIDIFANITNKTEERFADYRIKVKDYSLTFGGGAPLAAGLTSYDIPISFTVSEGMLDKDLVFIAEYQKDGSSNWETGKSEKLTINRKTQTPVIACTAKANQTLAAAGDQITFSFKIENQGFVDLSNIQIWSDSLKKGSALNSTPWTITSKHSYDWSYKYTFTAPKTVKFYITYTVSGSSNTLRYDVSQQFELKEEDRKVVATLSVDDSTPDPGQEVTFTLTIKNEGNVDYTNLAVTCDGEDMSAPARSLAQGAELNKQYKKKFDVSTDIYFTVSVRDHTGETRSVNTNTIHILLPIDPAALQGGLKLVIEPDRDEFTSAGVVNFSGYISNDSEYTLSDVSVSETSLSQIFSVSEMAADTKLPISYSADINETTAYTFTLSVKDRNGQVYTVSAEPITVTIHGSETVTANPGEDAVDVTLPPDNGSSDPLLVWFIIAGVLVLLIIGVGAALFVLWRNGRSPSRSSRSMAPKAKRPVRGGYNKSVKSRSFRDRNNF